MDSVPPSLITNTGEKQGTSAPVESAQVRVRLARATRESKEDTSSSSDEVDKEVNSRLTEYSSWRTTRVRGLYTAFSSAEEDEQEAEEKSSTAVHAAKAKLPREKGTVSDKSTVPTRAQREQAHHRAKNLPWPTPKSRKKQYQARRAPVREGKTVYFSRDDQPRETKDDA